MPSRFANIWHAFTGRNKSDPFDAAIAKVRTVDAVETNPYTPPVSPTLEAIASDDVEAKGALTFAQMTSPGAPRPLPNRPEQFASEGYEGNTLIYRCVSIVAQAVASIPLKVMAGDKEAPDHPLALLLQRPNPTQDQRDFLDPLDPRSPFASKYMYEDGNPQHNRTWEVDSINGDCDMIHWRSFAPLNRWWGMPAIKPAASDVDQHTEAGEWNRKMLANNMQPPGMLVSSKALDSTQVADLKAQVSERFTGSKNARKPLVLTGEFSWTAFGNDAQEMDWLNGRQMAAWNICAAYGVPTQVVPVPGGQTFANYEQARLALWEDTVIPTAQKLAGLLNRTLVPRYADAERRKLRIVLDLENIPALATRRAEKRASVEGSTIMSLNEKRLALGLPKLENPEADAVLTDAAKLPVSPTVEKDEPDAAPTAGGVPVDGTVQDTAMNGAQITGLIEILTAVTGGQLPPESAQQMLTIAFPFISPTEAAALIKPLVEFVPEDRSEDTGNEGGEPVKPDPNEDPEISKQKLGKRLRRLGLSVDAVKNINAAVFNAR